MLKVLKVTPSI